MAVRVEFYGVPRLRAGVAEAVIELDVEAPTLGQVLDKLAGEFPGWAAECLQAGALRPSYVANLQGQRFVRDRQTPVPHGQCLLILAADAGG